LDPDSFFGFQLQGLIAYKRGDVKKSYNYTKRAVEIEPNNPEAIDHLIWMNALLGKTESSDELINRLLLIDPLTPHTYWVKGLTSWMRGNFEDAVPSFRKFYEFDTKSVYGRCFYALALFMSGKESEAIPLTDQMAKDNPDHFNTRYMMFTRYALEGKKEKALSMFTEAAQTFAEWDTTASWIATQNYALVGENQKALDWLEYSVDRGFINYPFLAEYDPFLENIRGEPRFKKLMERVKHEWENFEV
jgi:tetratricopeptide (TPR) repeat protein